MHDLSNWATLIANVGIIISAITAILDFKLKEFRDNQRLQYRYEICSFTGDLRNGIFKTREEFQAIFEMYDRYEKIIKKLKQTNHFIDNEIAYVTEQYKLLKNN